MAAIQKHEELQEPEVMFRPCDQVSSVKTYQYKIFQDYACLTTEEFVSIFNVQPSHAMPKVKSVGLPWTGPEASGKKLTHFWLVGLDGMPPECIPWVRKARLEYCDGVLAQCHYVRPEDQLVKDQGKAVFGWLFDNEMASRPEGLTASGKGPISHNEITARLLREEELKESAAAAKRLEHEQNDGDEFDSLLSNSSQSQQS